MSAGSNGRPPFRADHVGSLLRPQVLRQAFRDHCGQDRRRGFARIQDGASAMSLKYAGGCRAEGRDRRRIPPRLLLGALRGAHRRLYDQARGVQVSGRSRPRGRIHRALWGWASCTRNQPLALDEFKFLRGRSGRRRRRSRCRRPRPCISFAAALRDEAPCMPMAETFLRTSPVSSARKWPISRRRLPLHTARRGRARADVRSGAQQVVAAGRSRTASISISRLNDAVAARPADVVFGVHMCRGNFKGTIRRGRLRIGCRAILRDAGQSLPARIRHAARRRFRAAALRQGQGRRARPDQHQGAGVESSTN